MAKAQQEERSDHVHIGRNGGGTAGRERRIALQRPLQQMVGEQPDERMRAMDELRPRIGRVMEVDQQLAIEVRLTEALAQRGGQVLRQETPGLPRRLQRRIEAGTAVLHETGDGGLVADKVELSSPFREDFVGLEAALCEDGAVGLRLLQGVFPRGGERLELLRDDRIETEIELRTGLASAGALEQRRLDHRVVDPLGILRKRHHHPEILPDEVGLLEDHLEDETVDRVVLPVEHGAADFLRLLAEAIDTALALLVAGGIPREVVMDDRGEAVLEVDAFGEAVGRDEDRLLGLGQLGDALLPFLGREFAGDRLDGGFAELRLQMRGNIMSGREVAAEDHRPETLGQQGTDVFAKSAKLRVALLPAQLAGAHDERLELVGFVEGTGRLEIVGDKIVDLAVLQSLVVGQGLHLLERAGEAGVERPLGGRRRGTDATQQGQRGVPDHVPAGAVAALGALGELHAIVLHGVEKLAPFAGQAVRHFGREPAGKDACILPLLDVLAAALDEVLGELLAESAARGLVGLGELGEVLAQEREEIVESAVVAGVRSRRKQDQVALGIIGQLPEKLEAQLPRLAAGGTAVRLVDDDALRGDREEMGAVAVALDVVETDHNDGVVLEKRDARRQLALQAGDAGGGERDRLEMEMPVELGLPLLDQMRRTEHGEAGDLAAIMQLAHDQARFDRLADADVVGNQQANRRLAERHQQRHELIRPRLDGDVGERAERTGTGAKLELQRIA